MQLKFEHIFNRSIMMIGYEKMNLLENSCVAVFGLGGVGGYCAEVLARAGIGKLILIDYDEIKPSNLNRQIHALADTLGEKKVRATAERLKKINPTIQIKEADLMFNEQTLGEVFTEGECIDYCIDAIDTVSSKILLICHCSENNIPLISSMGTGNKLDASRFVVTDIYKTHTCPLAKVMRAELKKRGIKSLDVVFSDELPKKPVESACEIENGSNTDKRRSTPGSMSFVPPVSGILMASHVVNTIINV